MALQIGTQVAGPDRMLTDDNFAETMETLAEVGFEGVELTWYPTHYPEETPFGDYFGYSAREVGAIFEEAGMTVIGSHALLGDLQADLESAIEFHRQAGCDRIGIVEMPAEYFESRSRVVEGAGELRNMAATVADAGMELYLHNHDHEFEATFDGETGFAVLLESLDGEVPLQIDLSHVMRTGHDPIALLESVDGDVSSLHVSDMAGTEDVPMGEGEIDYEWVIDFARENDVDWLILEEKSARLDEGDALSILRQDYEYLRDLVA